MRLYVIIKQYRNYRSRYTCNNCLEPHTPGIFLHDRLCLVFELERPHLIPEYGHDSKYRSKLYHHEKHFLEISARIQ